MLFLMFVSFFVIHLLHKCISENAVPDNGSHDNVQIELIIIIEHINQLNNNFISSFHLQKQQQEWHSMISPYHQE